MSTSYSYNGNNELLKKEKKVGVDPISTTWYTYDVRGNLLSSVIDEYSNTETGTASGITGAVLGENETSEAALYEYDVFGKMEQIEKGSEKIQYSYNADGQRIEKTIDTISNSDSTQYIWDGDNIAAEKTIGTASVYYQRGLGLLARENDESSYKEYYFKNAHGDVTGLYSTQTNSMSNTYEYDPFGNQIDPEASGEELLTNNYQGDPNDTNPFRYAGEYFDEETGSIYLRARYYMPSTGRFTQEDPMKDGLNWYIYCTNNPINLIDPLGLFDFNTRLSYNQLYNDDVKVLQNELVWLGYMDAPASNEWGYFGSKTQAAVNRYKEDRGLWNEGKDKGVVGATTWQSLGLIYRTQADINAGVKIATRGKKQYFDVTTPVNTAVYNAGQEAKEHRWDFNWFRSKVDHGKDWDIKRSASWTKTIGSTYPGSATSLVIFEGNYTTPEELGNMMYGYTGTAAGFYDWILLAGGDFAAGGIGGVIKQVDSPEDKQAIKKGIDWYYGR